jgi:hypothetical protein
MKTLVSTLVICFGLINYLHSKKEYNWSIPKGKITHVFEYAKKSNQIELLRLYNSGEYEQLLYINQEKKSELVKRNLGTFLIKRQKLLINKPTYSEFQGYFKSKKEYFINNDLYESRIDCLLKKKNAKLKKQTKSIYKKPFYIGFNSDEIVSNDKIEDAFTLEQLVNYIIKDINDDKEKVLAISKFICRSIEYDYDGYHNNNYAHYQGDIEGILASRKRLAVCAGYANVFDCLAKYANIKSHVVVGFTKQSYADINMLAGLHAWNIVEVNGKNYYIDVTWADDKKNIEMKWMFVDPELMLLSHYPDNKSDILWDQNFSENQFKSREIVLPTVESAKIKHFPINGLSKIASNTLLLKFKSKVELDIYWLDSEISLVHYNKETKTKKNTNYEYHEIDEFKTYSSKDTFYVEIPISKNEISLYINVSGEYYIQMNVFLGGDKEFFQNKIAKWNRDHAIDFVEGILVAIKNDDKKFLKEKLGDNYYKLYNKKGQWISNKEILKNIKNWDGSSYGLTNSIETNINNGKSTTTIYKYIQFNSTDKFYVDYTNNKYDFLCIK